MFSKCIYLSQLLVVTVVTIFMLKLRPYQKELIQKTYESMANGNKRPLVVAPTGSGKTAMFAWMAEQTQAKNNNVWFLVHRVELFDQTVETFEKFNIERKSIYVGMIRRQNKDFPDPDLIVLDEAHHSTAGTWQKIINRFPDSYIIGLTATPCRLDGAPLGFVFDDLVVGPTTADLIESGYLSEYRYFSINIADLEDLKTRGRDYDSSDSAGRLITVCGDVVKHFKKYAAGLQAICFCASVEHSKEMARVFRENGISAEHFDGTTLKKKRKELVNKFKNKEIQILSNVELIGEGFDMPDCDCVIQLRPTKSLSLYLQQCGRALRPRENKVAIILDHVGNHTRHGLPCDPREWSLETRIKEKPKFDEKGQFIIRQCENCFAVYSATLGNCPECGNEYRPAGVEIRNLHKYELEEIKRTHISKPLSVDEAENYQDLLAIAKQRGYKTGWAYYQAKLRGFWI